MKVLIEATVNFKPLSGGISEFTDQIARSLTIHTDSEVCLVSRKMENYRKFDQSVPYSVKRYEFGDDLFKFGRLLGSGSSLRSFIKNFHPDVILSNFISLEAQILWFFSRVEGIPYVQLVHGQEVNRTFQRCFKAGKLKSWLRSRLNGLFVLNRADRVLANSNFTKNLVKDRGVAGSKIDIVHPVINSESFGDPVKASEFIPKNKSLFSNVFLTLGSLRPRKGIDKTLDALVYLREEGYEFSYLIAGKGKYEQFLRTKVSELNLNERVIFTGYLSRDQKALAFERADVFVMPSRENPGGSLEGFGIVFLEAAYHGLPSIGGRSGGIPDAVKDGVTGFLVDPEDSKDIAKKMKRILESPEESYEMGQRARKRVDNEFRPDQQASKIRRALENV